MQSYHDMMCAALSECKREIDKYFELKVREYEGITQHPGDDPYPEELYAGISNPSLYFLFGFAKQDWDAILFNRKLMEYKTAYLFNGQEFFDRDHTLPVSKGWVIYCSRGSRDHVPLSCFHAEKARELKLNWKEYNEKYLAPKGWFK